jgi:non-specific serine/threonine protein kinase
MLRDVTHVPWPPVDQPDVAEVTARLRAALAPAVLQALLGEGAHMTVAETLAYALETLDAFPAAAPDATTGFPPSAHPQQALTPRQHEVATLVGQGLSNRQIAGALTIAERTAENHVEHILTKLGFHSRAQIAAWAAQQGLAPPSAN